jgi:hypothetical protein
LRDGWRSAEASKPHIADDEGAWELARYLLLPVMKTGTIG